MEVIRLSDEKPRDWRAEVDCEHCADWDGPPPVPLAEARKAYPPRLGFKVSHADYRAFGEDGEMQVIPTTVVRHPGMYFPVVPQAAALAAAASRRDTARAMSRENVEVVRRHILAYESGDYEAALAAYHPDVVCDATVRPEGRVYRGREGVAEAIRVWAGTWDEWRWDIEELIDAGERVLMVVRESATGKGSGVEVVQQTFWVYTLRRGQIVHAKVLVDRSQALKAAGVRSSAKAIGLGSAERHPPSEEGRGT